MQKARLYAFKIAVLVAVLAFAFWLARLAQENTFIQELVVSYGYLGIFLISIASGFNLVLPIPAVSFLPLYLEAGLNFWITIGFITLGMTLADSLAYFIGFIGRDIATRYNNAHIFQKIDQWSKRNKNIPLVVMFVYASLAPFPNEVLLIPLGIMRCRFIYLFPIVLAGNTIFNILTAFGVLSIFNFFA